MEIKVNLEVSLSASTLTALQNLIGGKAAPVEETGETEKRTRTRTAKAETPAPANNGKAKGVDLSTVRQWVNKTDDRKNAARELFTKYEVTGLSELGTRLDEFYNELVSNEENQL